LLITTMASSNEFDPNKIAQTIAALHAASWQRTYRGIFDDAYLDHDVTAERLRFWQTRVPELASGVGEIFLARVANVATGFICVEIGPEREWGVFVDNLHVLPNAQGQGIGKLLIAAAERWAATHGESQLYLRVYEDNLPARQFYAHEGWRAVAREMDDLPGGGRAAVLKLVKKFA
jgi:GNAT superfamily N-acetyltransferase